MAWASDETVNEVRGVSAVSPQSINLSLEDAISMGLKNNLTTLLAEARTEEAKGRVLQSASQLLPHVLIDVSQMWVGRENLSAMGFPEFGLIGPYSSFDGRIKLVQKIFDLSAIEGYQAEKVNSKIAHLDVELATKQVTVAVCLTYLAALRAESQTEAALADLNLARQLLKLSRHQNLVGLATSLDVARFETRVAEEETQYLQTKTDLHRSYIELNRVVGLPLTTRLKLTDTLHFRPEHFTSAEKATAIANNERTELKIAQERIHRSDFKLREAQAERLPKIEATADGGLSGENPNNTARTVTEAGVSLNMPIFEGGMIEGEISEANSFKHQAQLFFNDLIKQVQEDVRLSVMSVAIDVDRVSSAKKTLSLATKELELSKDRFSAGLSNNLEVVDAQATLARARQEYIFVLSQYNEARVNLYSAMGNIEAFTLAREKGI